MDQKKIDERVEQYVRVRDAIKAMDERHQAEKQPLIEIQNLLTGWMMDFLKTTGSQSVKTKAGTCYASTRHTASLADPDAFMKFVIDNGAFDLLDRRANATAVKDYVAANAGNLPPGVNLSAIQTLGVRRA